MRRGVRGGEGMDDSKEVCFFLDGVDTQFLLKFEKVGGQKGDLSFS